MNESRLIYSCSPHVIILIYIFINVPEVRGEADRHSYINTCRYMCVRVCVCVCVCIEYISSFDQVLIYMSFLRYNIINICKVNKQIDTHVPAVYQLRTSCVLRL